MTALDEYARLESSGLWRASTDAQRREVGVSFGEATLVISDAAGRPLAHWSLPAVQRIGGEGAQAVYSPDAEASETLEIDDDLMIDAIDRVRRSLARRRPRPGRLRRNVTLIVLAAVVGLAVVWFPSAVLRQTLAVVPPAKRSEIGATLLGHLQRATGPSCRDTLGVQALARLHLRVLGRDAPGQIVVLPDGPGHPLYLPGGIIILSDAMILAADEPAVIAGHVLSAATGRAGEDPLSPLLEDAGLRATMTLLTTGDLPEEALRDHATRLLTGSPRSPADPAELEAAFDLAQVPIGPWATVTGSGPFVAARTGAPDAPVVLSDGDWIALQGICGL